MPTPHSPRGAGARLLPPPGGAVIRFYRIGHGDCFLLAFAGDDPDEPSYVLIDFGYKPGSPGMIDPPTSPDEVAEDLKAATGGRLDVAVITHEHQDHLNAITAGRLAGLDIRQTWFSWVEQPDDALARDLRRKHGDTVMGLIAARQRLAAAGDEARAARVRDFLELELGDSAAFAGDASTAFAAASNRTSMKLIRDAATSGPRFLRPHTSRPVPGAANVRAYVLGPPRDAALLELMDPEGDEEFHLHRADAGMFRDEGAYFAAASRATPQADHLSPFEARFAVPWDAAFQAGDEFGDFIRANYGAGTTQGKVSRWEAEVPADAPWRRIDHDWLRTADALAIKMGEYTNNTSLVLAFELGRGGKVLLFAADAQRGNWLSWGTRTWTVGGEKVTAQDLLARTVLYKVGHHGSHNATLHGRSTSDHANLAWMGHDEAAREFTAMITAVRAWAETQKGWDHPFGPIKEALLRKANGRVFQTDTPVEEMEAASDATSGERSDFRRRTVGTDLYFDYAVEPRSDRDEDPGRGAGRMPMVPPPEPEKPTPTRRKQAGKRTLVVGSFDL